MATHSDETVSVKIGIRITFAVAVAAVLVAGAPRAIAQLPIPIPLASSSTAPYGTGVKQLRGLDTAPITFEGIRLFTIAAPPPTANDAIPPIVRRVDAVEENLDRIVPTPGGILQAPESRFDPDTFRVEIGKEGGYPTLYATDGHHVESAQILTVTEADATANGMSSDKLAIIWQADLQSALAPAVKAFSPAYYNAQLKKLPWVLGGAVVLTIVLWLFQSYLGARADALKALAEGAGATEEIAKSLYTNRRLINGGRRLVRWSILLLWLLVAKWVFGIFPATRGVSTVLTRRLVAVAIFWIGLAALNYVISLFILKFSEDWLVNPFLSPEDRARMARRRPTIVGVIDNLKTIVVLIVAVGGTLKIFAVSYTSELAIGAIAVFGLSFAAQSIVKDYVSGFLILAEDQFAIGDRIAINAVIGIVENVTLRITQLRTDDGTLVTVSNSTIMAVENLSRGWSRVDFHIAVALDSDVEHALKVLRTTLAELGTSEQWKGVILEPPEVLGVESVTNAGVMLRAWVKAKPSAKPALAREINRRVEEAFRANGVEIGRSQMTIVPPKTPT